MFLSSLRLLACGGFKDNRDDRDNFLILFSENKERVLSQDVFIFLAVFACGGFKDNRDNRDNF
mgnify:CR=1 FL=1